MRFKGIISTIRHSMGRRQRRLYRFTLQGRDGWFLNGERQPPPEGVEVAFDAVQHESGRGYFVDPTSFVIKQLASAEQIADRQEYENALHEMRRLYPEQDYVPPAIQVEQIDFSAPFDEWNVTTCRAWCGLPAEDRRDLRPDATRGMLQEHRSDALLVFLRNRKRDMQHAANTAVARC